jgi:hypothetical protein
MESTAYSTASAPVVGVQDTGKRLSLAQMTHVAGSNVIRQELVERDASAAFRPDRAERSRGSAGVRDLQAATIDQDGMLTVLFERDRKYVLALFDPVSLEKNHEQELAVPVLK